MKKHRVRFLFLAPLALGLTGCGQASRSAGDFLTRLMTRSVPDVDALEAPVPKLPRKPRKPVPPPSIPAMPPLPIETIEQTSLLQKEQAGAATWAASALSSSLKPVNSGEGLFVCEPVPSASAEVLGSFGDGCGRWLFLNLGGQGELGQTPHWGAIDDGRREMGRADMRLAPNQIAVLARKFGVTRVATGKLDGNAKQRVLSYQLWSVPAGRALGAPVAARGTLAQLVAGLPGLARRLAAQLGLKSPHLPAVVGVSESEMSVLGSVPWKARIPIDEAPALALEKMVPRTPLAGVLLMRSKTLADDDYRWQVIVKALLAQAPDNCMVWAEMARNAGSYLTPYKPLLLSKAQQYPNNFMMALATTDVMEATGNRKVQRQAAMQGIRCAPRNPCAWTQLGEEISDEAEDLRQGRTVGDMSQAEMDRVGRLYPYWLQCGLQASRLDPDSIMAWLQVCQAASFGSSSEVANAAFWRAARIDRSDQDVIRWGLQMYQPKWSDDTKTLLMIAQMVESDPRLFYIMHRTAMSALAEAGLDSEGNALMWRCLARLQWDEAHHPKDPWPFYYVGLFGKLNGISGSQDKTCIDAWTHYLSLRPRDAKIHYELGWMLHYKTQQYNDAEKQYRQALAIRPTYADATNALADLTYYVHHDASGAERLYRHAIALNDDGLYHAELARLLLDQNKRDEALAEAHKAIALGYTESNPAFDRLGLSP